MWGDDRFAPPVRTQSARPAPTRSHACGHWQTHTVLIGLSLRGLTAPAVFNGPLDNDSSQAYVDQVLAPALRPGDVVVLDDLAIHKHPARRGDRSRRCHAPVSAALQSRLQSDRAGIREAESVSARRAAALVRRRHGTVAAALTLFSGPEITSAIAAIASLHSYEKCSKNNAT